MDKNFEIWNIQKRHIDAKKSQVFFHEREVWWCSLGANVGYEEDGKGEIFARPVIIFKKFNNQIFWAIPLTHKIKQSRFYTPVVLRKNETRTALISQLRLLDAKRLLDKIATISIDDFKNIQKAVISLCSS